MSKLVGQKNTESMLNSYNYSDLGSLKKGLRQLLRLEQRAMKGNEAAMILITDLKDSLGVYSNSNKSSILTPRQREVILYCLIRDHTEQTTAELLGTSQQSVHAVLNSGVKRIRKYLSGEQIVQQPKFSKDDTQKIITLYKQGKKPKEIADLLGKELRPVQTKIKVLKQKGKLSYSRNKETDSHETKGPVGN